MLEDIANTIYIRQWISLYIRIFSGGSIFSLSATVGMGVSLVTSEAGGCPSERFSFSTAIITA